MEGQMFSSSLGAMGSILAKLRSLLVSPKDQLPEPLKPQKHKLELLTQDLEGINALLVNHSWVEAPNMMVKHWMNQVRDLSYDIEDYIDRTMRPGPDPNTNQDSRCVDEELSILVKQVNDAHERHIRYYLWRWASNPKFVVDGQGPVPRHNGEPTYLVGIDDSKAELIKRLNIDAERRLVVSIQGHVGVGKTTLAKEVYREIEGQFECRAFVRASKTPDTRRLLSTIISQVQSHHRRPPHGLPVQELIDRLRELLQHKRYFIVIDGLWETASWDIVNNAFPEDTHCSRILITTDVEEVALECCDYESDAIFNMEPLSGNQSTELFFTRMLGFKHEHLEQLRKNTDEIIRTCHGLPLAIISTASIFTSQPNNSELWRHVKEALFSRLRYNLTLEGMLREIIVLSYNSLPHHLKTCLIYLSMYPEGYTFLKADLVKQWGAEGFIVALENKNCDEVAECYFDDLVCRGLIQPNDINISEEVISYTVHCTVFEVIRNMSVEENFTTVIDYSDTISVISAKVRRLSLRFSSTKYATKPENITLSSVRSLIFYGFVDCLPSMTQFEALRVLILEFWGNEEELDLSGIDKLFQLRYLQIRTNIIVQLPARMIGLSYVQTMEIYARVTSVPSDIIHLPRLLHLCLHGEINLSNGIGHMRSLRTLQSFDLSSNSEATVRQLGEMKDLHDLHVTCSTEISDPLKRNLMALASSLEKLGNLKSIILAPAPSRTSIYLDCSFSISSLSVLLQRLVLLPPICIFPRLPVWIGHLQRLCILKIVLGELRRGDVDSITRLPELTILSLYVRQPTEEHIVFHRAAFPVLKCFKFRCGVMRLAFQADAMPNLRRLKLEFNAHSGEQNANMLAGIENLSNLQEITGRIGAAPGAEESGKMAAESLFKDAIRKHSRLISFNLRIAHLFDKDQLCRSNTRKGSVELQLVEGETLGVKRQRSATSSDADHEQTSTIGMAMGGEHFLDQVLDKGLKELLSPSYPGENSVRSTAAVAARDNIAHNLLRSGSGEKPNMHSMAYGIGEPSEAAVLRDISPFKSASPKLMSDDDGYNWLKYGQAAKGSKNPRSYYKCTFPRCPMKKKVTRMSLDDDQITSITYKGSHNHAKPPQTNRSTALQQQQLLLRSGGSEASEHTFGGMSGITTVTVPTAWGSSFASIDMDEVSSSCTGSSTGTEVDEHEVVSKRRRKDRDGEAIRAANPTTPSREPRLVVETISDVDTFDDGCRWRKYGQKQVKFRPHPRSYYRCCTATGCPVRKHVQRATHDARVVITTYKGKHNHDVREPRAPAAMADQSSGAGAGQQQDAHGFRGLGGAVSVPDVPDTHETAPAVAGGRKARVEADEPHRAQGCGIQPPAC